jgi:nitroreductase/NAD-dependent dihydropyrimidine dehydrogenase PreA subunit
MVKIDESKCSNCDLCYEVCIGGPIFKGPSLRNTEEFHCVECGHCYAICPEGAITLGGFGNIETSELGREPAVDGLSMKALLKGRRSGRLFKPEPVSREHLEELIEVASCAPSAHNAHQVRAYVYRDDNTLRKISEGTRSHYRRLLKMFGRPGFPLLWRLMGYDPAELEELKGAFSILLNPVKQDEILNYGSKTLLAFTAPRRNVLAVGDAWIAAQNAVIHAEAIGVANFYNGFIIMAAAQSRPLRKVMGIPKDQKVVAVLTLGYPKRRFRREAPRKTMPTTWA